MKTRTRGRLAGLMLGTALLAGCNGGGSPAPDSTADRPVGPVVVVGDSLADIGSFGARATIQNSADPAAGFPLFPELLAQQLGAGPLCNHYFYDEVAATFVTRPRCRNFAVGGSRIANPAYRGGDSVPLHIPTQLAQAVAAAGGRWSARDVLLVEGGTNDLTDLAIAYLGVSHGRAEEFRARLLELLDAAVVDPLLATGASGYAEAGRLYMQALASTYQEAIETHALARGATRVIVLNLPDVTLTPRVRTALALVATLRDQTYADAAAAALQTWAELYNQQLQAGLGADARVALVDFYTAFTYQIRHAERYGISNTLAAACPVSSVDILGVPRYSLEICTTDALDAAPPEGLAAGWWQTWLFADDFHLTPFGHELLAATIRRTLVLAGWAEEWEME